MEQKLPGLPYAAGLFGSGSEVLGFDTPMSTDHNWGPRVHLISERAFELRALRKLLPREFLGFEVHPENSVEAFTIETLVARLFGPQATPVFEPVDWLLATQQELRSLVDGPIFHDGIGFSKMRSGFDYYPDSVYFYLLASLWSRIGEEEHLVGRAGFVGDELGARITASRLVRDLMRMGFLLERTYMPYQKWFGSAYRMLKHASAMEPLLLAILDAQDWRSRDVALSAAYQKVARQYASLRITPDAEPKVKRFFDRPFHVVCFDSGVVDALRARIEDRQMREICGRRQIEKALRCLLTARIWW